MILGCAKDISKALLFFLLIVGFMTVTVPHQWAWATNMTRGEPAGEFVVDVFKKGEWHEAGSLAYNKFLREKELSLAEFSPEDKVLKLRLIKKGGGAAHIDALLLGGEAPAEVNQGNTVLLKKLSRKDYDVAEVTANGIEFSFQGGQSSQILSITGRIEGDRIDKTPFQFPISNLYQNMNKNAEFYVYTMNSQKESLVVDGIIPEVSKKEPFFKQYVEPGSGHPSGLVYGWVCHDGQNLYVTLDVTPDNTTDGNKDYAKVYAKTDTGLKEFKVSVPDTTWGKPAFIYTDRVPYQHKVYEFAIPLKELGLKENNRNGEMSLAFAAYGTMAPAPFNLKAFANSTSSIKLTWKDLFNNEDRFEIHRREGYNKFKLLTTLGTDSTSFVDTGLSAGIAYDYYITAYHGSKHLGHSKAASATVPSAMPPAAPSGLTASATYPSQVNLSWKDNSSIEKGFAVFRKPQTGSYKQIGTVGTNVKSYTDNTVAGKTTYFYRVRAYNADGHSDWSNEVIIATPDPSLQNPPAAPSDLTANALSGTEIELIWKDNSGIEQGFNIFRKREGGSYIQIDAVGAGVKHYLDSGLFPGTAYYYKLKTFNAAGNSNFSNEAGETTPGGSGAQPPGVPAPQPGKTEIRLYIDSNEYYVNNQLRTMDTSPIIRNNRTLLPIRYVTQPLGSKINWDSLERKATVSLGGKFVEVWIDDNQANVNGATEIIDHSNRDVVPIIYHNRTLLPLRFIAEKLGCKVGWDGALQEVTVTHPAH